MGRREEELPMRAEGGDRQACFLHPPSITYTYSLVFDNGGVRVFDSLEPGVKVLASGGYQPSGTRALMISEPRVLVFFGLPMELTISTPISRAISRRVGFS